MDYGFGFDFLTKIYMKALWKLSFELNYQKKVN